MSNLIHESESYAIRGACFEVYKEMGCGFLESVYQECLQMELGLRNVPFVPQPKVELEYKGRKLESNFQPDLICYGKVVLELKALSALTDQHRAQVHNYLRATSHRLGLLINFGSHPGVTIDRSVS